MLAKLFLFSVVASSVISLEMDSTCSQLHVESGFLKKILRIHEVTSILVEVGEIFDPIYDIACNLRKCQ